MTAPRLISVAIQRVTTLTSVPPDQVFQGWLEAALAIRQGKFSLAIRIVDEADGRRFNRDYCNRDYATNVLSFPAELPQGLPDRVQHSLLGDLLICAPVVAREARERMRPEIDHWAHLTIHGVLHLLGYDHQQPAEAQQMESLEVKILAGIGIPDPYNEPG